MIYTVTFNPAVDCVVYAGEIKIGGMNRAEKEEIYIGGKGINVSIVLQELGIRSKALGFVAGFTGDAIENGVAERGIETDFVHLEQGFSRINVKIRSVEETELNGQGPRISDAAMQELLGRLEEMKDGDTIVLAGSIPSSMPPDSYERILKHLSGRNIRAVVDAEGELLRNVLKYKPFLVKPNSRELGELFGASLTTLEEIVRHAAKLQEMGAENVLVSMAGDGAVFLDADGKTHVCKACRGTVKNSVGAGDSMTAGFLAGLSKGGYEYALKLGSAAGGATAFSEGLAEREEIGRLMEQLGEICERGKA